MIPVKSKKLHYHNTKCSIYAHQRRIEKCEIFTIFTTRNYGEWQNGSVFKLAQEVVNNGGTVLVLVPEISLTPKLPNGLGDFWCSCCPLAQK